MNHYVEHLSRELFRYSLTIIAVIFALFGSCAVLTLHLSTTRVLENSSTALSNYWKSSVTVVEAGVGDLASRAAVSDVLLSEAEPSASELASAMSAIYDTALGFPPGSSVIVVNKSGEIVASNLYVTNRKSFEESRFVNTVRKELEQNTSDLAELPFRLSLLPPHEGTFAVAARLPEPTGLWEGAMVIGVAGQEGLREVVRGEGVDRIIVNDEFSNVIFDSAYRGSSEPAPLSSKLEAEYPNFLTMRTDGVDYFYSSKTDPATGITATTLTPQLFFRSFVTMGLASMIASAALVLLLAGRLSRRRIKRSTAALEGLAAGIDQWFEGNLNYRLKEPQFAEFAGIYDSFNQLVEELETQVVQNVELAESRNALEVRHLETQFNPHFVFNTLELLRYVIRTDANAANRIVLDLAQLLRYSIRGGDQLVRIGEDLDYVRRYLDLYSIRLAHRLQYTISCPDDVADALVPRLILQPLLENALIHGENHQEPVNIALQVKNEGDNLIIEIADNGQGIDDPTLHEINTMLGSTEQPRSHLGIFLVHRMISLIYGDTYGLSITSNQTGTTATITLPFEL